MGHVAILETAHHMGDRVAFADVGEELVAEPFALRGAAHQSGDVDEGEPRRDDLLRAGDLGQDVEARIRHRDLPDIRLDGAERIVGRLRRRGLRQRVEERRFADIGQTDDAAFEAHEGKDRLKPKPSGALMRGPGGKGKGGRTAGPARPRGAGEVSPSRRGSRVASRRGGPVRRRSCAGGRGPPTSRARPRGGVREACPGRP